MYHALQHTYVRMYDVLRIIRTYVEIFYVNCHRCEVLTEDIITVVL